MEKSMDLQNGLLDTAVRVHTPVTVFFTNGYQMKGTVTDFDNYVIVLESDGRHHMIYKHAVSTIVPVGAVSPKESEDENDGR